MVFQNVEVEVPVRGCGPEDVVVVGEHGEEDAEEEACCWECVSSSFFAYVSLVMDEAFLGGLTTDDQECREGRDAAESHFVAWW